jgi:hypothetical protein
MTECQTPRKRRRSNFEVAWKWLQIFGPKTWYTGKSFRVLHERKRDATGECWGDVARLNPDGVAGWNVTEDERATGVLVLRCCLQYKYSAFMYPVQPPLDSSPGMQHVWQPVVKVAVNVYRYYS